MTPEIKQQFEALACRLSPENLCCDGELPQYQVRARLQGIRREWRALEEKAGMKVTEGMVWGWKSKGL